MNRPLHQKKKVLVIEDNELNCKLLQDVIIYHGHHIILVRTGSEGIEAALHEKPDLIICDILLPGISGIDVITYLKSSAMTKHIPILALTALATQDEKESILASGCNSYLSKPFVLKEFLTEIVNLLEGSNNGR